MTEIKIYSVYESFVQRISNGETGYILTQKQPTGVSICMGEPSKKAKELGDVVCVGIGANAKPLLAVRKSFLDKCSF